MERLVDSISLEYGDTKISFFGIKINDLSDLSVWHRHNYYEIHYCTDKIREYKFPDRNITFKSGQVLIIPPLIDHNTFADSYVSAQPPVALAFTLTKIKSNISFYDKITTALENNSLIPLNIPQISDKDFSLFRDINLYDNFLGLCKLKAIASNLIYHIFGSILNDVTFRTDNEESVMVLIDNLINDPQYTLSEIAKRTSYSQRQLSRIIKQHYGLSFSELRRKMKEAN